MFDITPVENHFILEYLPGARGEYVKVYLYGLLYCYHPRKEMNISDISRELFMSEEEVLAAFRYWERRGIVRRIRDHPPEWQYVNIKQKDLAGDDAPDPEYTEFCRDIENSFEGIRDFHGSELSDCYEWKEAMHLPTEVILFLLQYMAKNRGKHFKIRDAEKMAIRLSQENAFTAEEALEVLNRDEAVVSGLKKILRKLGMKNSPSDANLALYRKWTEDWRFTQEAIEEACDRTGTSVPSLALLDRILENVRQSSQNADGPLDSGDVAEASQRRQEMRQVLREVGQNGATTPAQENLYNQMRDLYPQGIILLAARECAIKQKRFDSVLKLLQSWKERGFSGEEEIREHISEFHRKEEFLKALKARWSGKEAEIGQKTVQLLDKWEKDLGFSREMISLAADAALEVRKPMAYMDKLLSYWAEKQIRTEADVLRDRREHQERYQNPDKKPEGKSVHAQDYGQRDYSGEQDEARRRMLAMMGGAGDA
ncbi:MAG: DnaD domain protein [Clostridia bacterium]|nr:DnaD domain protein [Clostridia bacterium]